jgi:uncharacterized protein
MKLVTLALLIAIMPVCLCSQEQQISTPGRYSGYSKPLYTEWIRSSQYVAARDGTKLAIDIYRPSVNGKPVDTPYPVLFQMTQYRRAFYRLDHSMSLIASNDHMIDLTHYGYIVVVADARGEGASYGTRRGPWDHTEANDAYDLIEWTARQPWSTGSVGMWGGSYMGGIQIVTAALAPPHLKAIFPTIFPFDTFDSFSTILPPEGPYYEAGNPDKVDPLTVPVDEDKDGAMLKAAIEHHRQNKLPGPLPYHDSVSETAQSKYYAETSIADHIKDIERSGVAIYNLAFWNNWLREGAFLSFANLTNRSKLTVLASPRLESTAFDLLAEHHRFFDYWLKGIQNGIMKEPRVYVCTANNDSCYWDDTWPPKSSNHEHYFLASAGPGNGQLTSDASGVAGQDKYPVIYDLTDQDRDEKGLTYTGPALASDLQITGYPIADLWIASTATDGDFYVYLEDLDESGGSSSITEGKLRASFRTLNEPPFNNFGNPWHRGNQTDVADFTPGEASELKFILLPTSYVVKKGHRVRLNLTCAAPGNGAMGTGGFRARTPRIAPPPVVTIYHDSSRNSSISLPVMSDGRWAHEAEQK